MASRELEHALSVIGDRWTLLIVDTLLSGRLRFGELTERLDGIAPNVLTKRLRQLEADGLVRSSPYSERPLRLTYDLTATGRDLAGALTLISTWGAGLGDHVGEQHHMPCGTALEARLWCPTCDVPVDEADASSDISV